MRTLYLQDGFPSQRVRASEHEEELILPEFAEVRDGNQTHPVTETCQWIDAVYGVNAHHRPETRLGSLTVARLCIPATPEHGITEIRRVDDGRRTKTYSLVTTVKTLGNADRPLLQIVHHPVTSRLVYDGKELFAGTPSEEKLGRELIQPIVQDLLADLGYGDPAEFSAAAVDLGQYRRAHDIEWPRPLHLTPLSTGPAPSSEPH